MQKIRIGIELDHVIRNINKQIAKYYQQDFDESVDLDEIDYKDDVIRTVCNFTTKKALQKFIYEDYPLEIFGHASQMERNLSRDLNAWLKQLVNQEEYQVEVFLYSMKEFDITIASSYFFLSKIASRVRKVVFPRDMCELYSMGDVFITANPDIVGYMALRDKDVILIRMNFNRECEKNARLVYDDFRAFLDDGDKLNKLINRDNTCEGKKSKGKSLWTWMQSLISYFQKKKEE